MTGGPLAPVSEIVTGTASGESRDLTMRIANGTATATGCERTSTGDASGPERLDLVRRNGGDHRVSTLDWDFSSAYGHPWPAKHPAVSEADSWTASRTCGYQHSDSSTSTVKSPSQRTVTATSTVQVSVSSSAVYLLPVPRDA